MDEADAIINAKIVSNLRKAVVAARETDHMYGRTSDHKRSLVHSIILAMLPTEEPFHLWRIAKQLGLGWGTYCWIYKAVHQLCEKL